MEVVDVNVLLSCAGVTVGKILSQSVNEREHTLGARCTARLPTPILGFLRQASTRSPFSFQGYSYRIYRLNPAKSFVDVPCAFSTQGCPLQRQYGGRKRSRRCSRVPRKVLNHTPLWGRHRLRPYPVKTRVGSPPAHETPGYC